MAAISIFEMLKIGIGPSSSHTMGPWLAALRFLNELGSEKLPRVTRIQVDLFGSLSKTGKGHGTDIAVQLGLCGHDPKTIPVPLVRDQIKQIKQDGTICLNGQHTILFTRDKDILFRNEQLPYHPNGISLTACSADEVLITETYYSIGGGFIVKENETAADQSITLPYPIDSAADMLRYCREQSTTISGIVRQNERIWRNDDQIDHDLGAIRDAMVHCIHRGCQHEGILPGGLNVKRRAALTAQKLLGQPVPEDIDTFFELVRAQSHDFQRVLDWVSCFALAVNEENAAFGRVVTAPTNGAAGVIPAVLMYSLCFCTHDEDMMRNFLLTAGEVGCIFKKGATISAAMGGCQAEIGVSSAMAAAALTEALGGTPSQAATAAEIAMEHHLGMTCDPIGGLVQVPCIERNAMGAIKAITAARMALHREPLDARVSLDDVIRTMWLTALDMNSKYKETSEGGLALQIAVNVSEC
ncbi:serine dehydratase alpha family protein [Lacunimicrobium album]